MERLGIEIAHLLGMAITIKNFDYLVGQIEGISERQLRAHFGLYQGYVKKSNALEEKLKDADPKSANSSYSEYSELQRRRAVPYNGAYLHELYFENLTGKKSEPSPELKSAIETAFGRVETWIEDIRGGMLSGHGWTLLVKSRRDGTLRNNVVEEHHSGLFIEQDILLALDGWEHAYMIDYGTSKSEYIEVLINNIDWEVVNRRYLFSERSALMAA
jgi:Fe-Mn family superoxide dismutase